MIAARRFTRLTPAEQRGMAVCYAVSLARREPARLAPEVVSPYGERYLDWVHPLAPSGRWMVPPRFLRGAERSLEWAESAAALVSQDTPVRRARAVFLLLRLHRRLTAGRLGRPAEIDGARRAKLRGTMAPAPGPLHNHLRAQARRVAERERRVAERAALDWLRHP